MNPAAILSEQSAAERRVLREGNAPDIDTPTLLERLEAMTWFSANRPQYVLLEMWKRRSQVFVSATSRAPSSTDEPTTEIFRRVSGQDVFEHVGTESPR